MGKPMSFLRNLFDGATFPAVRCLNLSAEQQWERIAAGYCCRCFPGIPVCHPSISSSLLFSGWAFLFGPFYYLFTGMWRKALVLGFLTLLSLFIPLGTASDAVALFAILSVEYAWPALALKVLGLVGIVLFCSGCRELALGITLMFGIVFFQASFAVRPLLLDNVSAFVWLGSSTVWLTLLQLGFFSLFARHEFWLLLVLLVGIGFWLLGLPPVTLPDMLPSALLSMLAGCMGVYDRYRFRVLKETFWW